MTGLRIAPQIGVLGRRMQRLKRSVRADEFRPELARHTKRVLDDCVKATPVRNEALITRAQVKQYEHRINYIPSVHTLSDPSLIVNDQGQPWVYMGGKWYLATNNMPPQVYGAYQQLNAERNRRIQTTQSDFVAQRKQARFLYQRSWWQVGQSLGLVVSVAAAVIASHTRRKPAKEPPKSYGQWRGGTKVLSVVIFNRFLDIVTKYWPSGNGKQILAQSNAKNLPRLRKECADKVKREISAARRS